MCLRVLVNFKKGKFVLPIALGRTFEFGRACHSFPNTNWYRPGSK